MFAMSNYIRFLPSAYLHSEKFYNTADLCNVLHAIKQLFPTEKNAWTLPPPKSMILSCTGYGTVANPVAQHPTTLVNYIAGCKEDEADACLKMIDMFFGYTFEADEDIKQKGTYEQGPLDTLTKLYMLYREVHAKPDGEETYQKMWIDVMEKADPNKKYFLCTQEQIMRKVEMQVLEKDNVTKTITENNAKSNSKANEDVMTLAICQNITGKPDDKALERAMRLNFTESNTVKTLSGRGQLPEQQ